MLRAFPFIEIVHVEVYNIKTHVFGSLIPDCNSCTWNTQVNSICYSTTQPLKPE